MQRRPCKARLIGLAILTLLLWTPRLGWSEPITGSGTVSGDGGTGSADVTVTAPDNWDEIVNPNPPVSPPNTGSISKAFTSLSTPIIIEFPYNFTGGAGSPSPWTTFTFSESLTNNTGVEIAEVFVELGIVDTATNGTLCGLGQFCSPAGARFTPLTSVNGLPDFANSLPDTPFSELLTGSLLPGNTATILFELAIPADNPDANYAIRQTAQSLQPGPAPLGLPGLLGLGLGALIALWCRRA